jgi:methionine-rich copper-binding protein CopC
MIGPPTIDSINPTNNSSTNNIGKVITITFNVPIVSGSSYNDITVTGPSGIVSTTSQINGNILTLTPTSSYINGNYYVNIPINAVTDLAGNNLTTTYNSNFTVDTVPPTVKTITPIKNAINIPTNQVIKITFSKAIKAGNMNITLTNSSGAPVTISTSINGNILTINHKALLTNGKYTLTLHTGSITDLTGNPLAIVGSSFTVDSIPPTVKTIIPVKNAIKIPTNQIIKITFSESIKAGNMAIELKTSTGKEILFTRTISGNTLTIKPKSLLSKGIKYTLILHTGCVTDLASNNLTAYSSCFTTV